jgi:predicted Zn finger-like uncharacterized protein
MIISCNNCNKKFDIKSNLIPEKGRLLQCSGCNYEWFFKNVLIPDDKEQELLSEVGKPKVTPLPKNDVLESIFEKPSITSEIVIPKDTEIIIKQAETVLRDNNKSKRISALNAIFVFIISFIALVVLIDTFKYPLSKIVPNIEFILYSLYETIIDIGLFFKDLIK